VFPPRLAMKASTCSPRMVPERCSYLATALTPVISATFNAGQQLHCVLDLSRRRGGGKYEWSVVAGSSADDSSELPDQISGASLCGKERVVGGVPLRGVSFRRAAAQALAAEVVAIGPRLSVCAVAFDPLAKCAWRRFLKLLRKACESPADFAGGRLRLVLGRAARWSVP
jgi:hypothetical protein